MHCSARLSLRQCGSCMLRNCGFAVIQVALQHLTPHRLVFRTLHNATQ
jgi:hypothetical protein